MLLAVLLVGCSSDGAQGAASAQPAEPSAPASAQATLEASQAPSRPDSSPADASGAARDAVPSRVVVESLGIDLPVVSGDLVVPDNAPDYPLCDVAQFLTTYRYPGRPGTTTWLYGHARKGMFLPMLEASQEADGAALIGEVVDVYATDNQHYRFRITSVHPHSTDRSIANDVPPDERRLVLQTSEGPTGTVPKLQVAASLIDVAAVDAETANPPAKPRECSD